MNPLRRGTYKRQIHKIESRKEVSRCREAEGWEVMVLSGMMSEFRKLTELTHTARPACSGPLSCTFKGSYNGKFCYTCFTVTKNLSP